MVEEEHKISPYWVLFEEELAARHEWLINLRWLAFLGALGAIFFGKYVFDLPLEINHLIPLIIFVGVYNCIFFLYDNHLNRKELPGKEFHQAFRNFANVQISVDLLTLGTLIHFSGGVENPFILYFGFHMIIASILLRRRDAFIQATLAIIMINTILILEGTAIIKHYPIFPDLFGKDYYRNPKFLFACSFSISSALYIMIFMASSISSKLRKREKEASKLTDRLQEQAEQLIEANKNLMELDAKKSRFLRRVEHELRAPLSAVQSCLKVIVDGYVHGVYEKPMELIARAEKRTTMLLSMITELLNLSRLQDINQPIKEEFVNVTNLYTQLFFYQKIKAEEKKIKIVSFLPDEPIFVLGDPHLLDNVFVNLVNNAIKYTPIGGEINISLKAEDGNMILKIKDTGMGIPEDNLNKVFEEFHRAPNAIETGFAGSGLGLAITKQIIENYKGKISVISELNKGSEFTVFLPLVSK